MSDERTLSYLPSWDEVTRVQSDAEAFYGAQGLDSDSVHAMSMVCTELVENAVKYGYFAQKESISATFCASDGTLSVAVSCPVAPDQDGHLERLDRMIQWIRGYQDPFEAYIERLKIVSSQSLSSKESGLGLVRIAYEGRAVVDFYVDQQDMLLVSAHIERER